MNRFSGGVIITLVSILAAGCSDGKITAKKGDVEARVRREGNRTVVSVSQDVELFGYYKSKKPDFRINLRYTPVQLIFTDYPNMSELPRPLPMSLAPANLPRNSAFLVPNYDEKLSKRTEPFSLPYRLRGKERVNDKTLDLLVASNQVERLQQYSLGNVSVVFSTLYAWEVTDVNAYKVRANPKNYIHMDTGFLLQGPTEFMETSIETSKKYGHGSLYEFFIKGTKFDKNRVFKIRGLFEDEKLKSMTDEMVWQIAQVEGIEGLFLLMDEYEHQSNRRITHFAIQQIYDFGIGQTFETKSEGRSSFFNSTAKSEAEAGARYTIHLGGVIAANKGIIGNHKLDFPDTFSGSNLENQE